MPERFASEAIRIMAGTGDTTRMATGEPGLSKEFLWRGLNCFCHGRVIILA
jgi:hypothetical protein